MSKKSEKRISLDKWLKQFSDDRKTQFDCIGCKASIGTIKPEHGEADYSSLVECPDCESIMFKVVRSDGSSTITAT